MKELYRKYRPKTFDDVLGQEDAVTTLRKKWESDTIPHAILLHGPYGTGKTTLGRIVARCLECGKYDFVEKNSADYRGIDEIRKIRDTVNQAPIDGPVRVWLLDEVHKATNDAQNAMLKLLEDPPDHVYFILATTEPEKLINGISQRTLKLKMNPIPDKSIYQITKKVCSSERIKLGKPVMKALVQYAGGSAREALQILDKIYQLDTEDEQIKAIEKVSIRTQTIQIARMLLNTKTKWRNIAPILKELQNEDPERVRYMILGYARTVLLSKDSPRAYRMLDAFRENFYDSKFAGVVAACYELLQE
jgi:DNA polymerase-3 subunit gamma/tau